MVRTDVKNWLSASVDAVRRDPKRGALNVAYDLYLSCWLFGTSRFPLGTNVFSQDWDLLVVLDACRTDVLREVAHEYDFLEPIDTRWSLGSASMEWMTKTFTKKYESDIERTAYVSANPYTTGVFSHRTVPPSNRRIPIAPTNYGSVDVDTFALLDEVFRYGVDDELGVTPPRTMTDRTIAASREGDYDRIVAHYMQPHEPYIDDEVGLGPHVFERLSNGELDRDEAWESYRGTLRVVLDEVELLLENVDADRVAITADHGEAFGELGFYGHTTGFPHPAVRRVPWVETTATDEGTYDPIVDPQTDADDGEFDVGQHLRDLGYL
ncbi:hypothetical protein [Halogeometricum limi]|uniref:Sulfatase n=1 Tax=Halogeometricum limi TaxID=555875 RepID=A0A1I6GUA4_9EURY|nr:hypothetical protein [Halogeometricum limi]SFR45825.1 hypothetical protein SAMN04488124_1546 [Halogeometricum limi]